MVPGTPTEREREKGRGRGTGRGRGRGREKNHVALKKNGNFLISLPSPKMASWMILGLGLKPLPGLERGGVH